MERAVRWRLRAVAVLGTAAIVVASTAGPALAGNEIWEQYGTNGPGGIQRVFGWGDVPADCVALPGDWDGDGTDTPGVACPVGETWTWFLQNQNDGSATDHWYNWGSRTCLAMVGDWDGNGTDTPGQVCGGDSQWRWQLTNTHQSSVVDADFSWGTAASCWPISGDWDGDRVSTPGVVCPSGASWLWRQHDANSSAGPDVEFSWGSTADCRPIWGDWNGDGSQTPGTACTSATDVQYHWRLHDANTPGGIEHDFAWGFNGRTPIVGDWDGDGAATPGTTTVAAPSAWWQVASLRGGSSTVYARSSYDYAPTVMKDGVYKMWWCGGVAGDFILYAESSSPAGPWHARGSTVTNSYNEALRPRSGTDAFDNLHTCDPSVVRAGGTYYMYYGALKARTSTRIEPTTIGVASSMDGLKWTRLNGGNPIIVPARDVNTPGLPSTYGAGQPSAVYLDGKFYLTYTDTTGYAGDGNGGGQYVLRSADPTFQTGVEELTATGFAPRTAANHTRHKLISSVSVDWQYVDLLQAFLIGIHSSHGTTLFRVFDKTLRYEVAPSFTIPTDWREGPGIVSRPDKHALPSAVCGVAPVDYLHAIGTTVATWNLAHRGFNLNTGLSCEQSNLPAVFDGFQLHSPALPLATVFGGQRIQWSLGAPVTHLSRNAIGVSSGLYHQIPYGGSVRAGQQVLGATGRPAAFNIDGRLWPVDCLEVITSNQSSITFISASQWDAYPRGASLKCVR